MLKVLLPNSFNEVDQMELYVVYHISTKTIFDIILISSVPAFLRFLLVVSCDVIKLLNRRP